MHPWRATLRTVVAYLVVALPAYAIGVPILLDEVGEYLPDGAVGKDHNRVPVFKRQVESQFDEVSHFLYR